MDRGDDISVVRQEFTLKQCEAGIVDGASHDGGHTLRNPVDWVRIKQLLGQCTPGSHANCPPYKPTSQLPPDFRVLDVEKERLMQLPAGGSHVALSYVWGQATSTMLASKQRWRI